MADTILNQQDPKWADINLGSSTYKMWASGCFVTEIAQVLGTTPDVVNAALNAVGGFAADGTNKPDGTPQLSLVIWSKLALAFPGITAVYKTPYDNADVLSQLTAGNKVLCEVSAAPIGGTGIHCVEYIGNQQLNDPWTGKVRPTTDFGTPSAYVVISGTWDQTKVLQGFTSPTANMYGTPNQYDLNNPDSMKIAVDMLNQVLAGNYVKTEIFDEFVNGICDAIGITPTTNLTTVQKALQNKFDAIKASVITTGAPAKIPATSVVTTPPSQVAIGEIQTPVQGQKTVITIKPDPTKPANVIVSAKTTPHKVAIDYIEDFFSWIGKVFTGSTKNTKGGVKK